MASILLYIAHGSQPSVIIPVVWLWRRDIKHIKAYYDKESLQLFNKLLIILAKLYFAVTIIRATIVPIAMLLPILCDDLRYIGWIHYTRPLILTFYQIKRYSLVSDINLVNKLMINILYCIAFILLFECMIGFYLIKMVYDHETLCWHELTRLTWLLSSIFAVIYITWDWIVIFLLYHKLRQFRNNWKNSKQNKNNKVSKKLLSMFSKIFLLTIMSELSFVSNAVFAWFSESVESVEFRSFSVILKSIELSTSIFVIYLMNEHNKTDFIAFIAILEKLKCICCFKTLLQDSKPNNNELEMENRANNVLSNKVVEHVDIDHHLSLTTDTKQLNMSNTSEHGNVHYHSQLDSVKQKQECE